MAHKLRINWLRPVTPRGPKPIQILLDWFSRHEDAYLQSTDQPAELRRLCVELNARGVKCVLEDILRDFGRLQDTLQDDSVMHQVLTQDLLQHRERLLRLVLVTKREPDVKKDTKFVTRFSWLRPSPTGGPSATDLLVTWLVHNYVAYCSKKGKRTEILTELLLEIEVAGHPGCTIDRVQSQIRRLHRIMSGKRPVPASLTTYSNRLREIMKNRIPAGDSPHKRKEEDSDTSSDSEVPEITQVTEVGGQDVDMLDPSIESDRNIVRADESIGSSGHLQWLDASPTEGPCALEMLVQWLKVNYTEYIQADRKGMKKEMLTTLLVEMHGAGHEECTVRKIQAQIDKLRRQAEGLLATTAAFEVFESPLREIFNGESSGNSLSGVHDREFPLCPCVNQEGGPRNTTSGEDDQTVPALPRGVTLRAVRNDSARNQQAFPRIKAEFHGSRNAPICIESDDKDQEQQAELPSCERQQRGAPSSTSEVALIASILRERHDLKLRGVPQEDIDRYLPLP